MNNNLNSDKYYAAMLGAVVGDALGWPYEDRSNIIGTRKEVGLRHQFRDWTRRCGSQYYKHKEIIKAGEYSDDSQLLFATARSLSFGQDWSKAFLMQELSAWLLYQRGGGGATLRAAESWSKGIVPWKNKELKDKYFEAGGNGVAMRILPHVFYNDTFKEIAKQVVINGIATHGHPRALLGAIVYAKALYYLINNNATLGFGELITVLINSETEWGEFPRWQNADEWLEASNSVMKGLYLNIWEETVHEIKDGLMIIKEALDEAVLDNTHSTLAKINCFNPKVRGAGTIAALVSIYVASKYASDPNTGMLEILSLDNADTDTLASMVGGLFGTIYGSDGIKSDWHKVQDYKYIEFITKNPFILRKQSAINSWMDSHNHEVKQRIKRSKQGDDIFIGPFGRSIIVDKKVLDTDVNKLEVISCKLETEEGQTVYIKTFSKTNNVKQVEEDKGILKNPDSKKGISSFQLKEIAGILSGRFSAKRAFCLLAEIMEEIETKESFTNEDIDELSSKLVQTGIDLTQVRSIVKYLIDSDKLN